MNEYERIRTEENLNGREIERLEAQVDGAHAVQTRHDQEDACAYRTFNLNAQVLCTLVLVHVHIVL